MMLDKAVRFFGAVISSLVCGAFVACAGGDTPTVNDDLEDAITQNFGNRAVGGGAGGGTATGSAGRPAAGSPQNLQQGGAPSSTGGTAAVSEPPGDDDPPPNSGECDGFEVLSLNCSGSECHGGGARFGDFAASEDAARAFVGVNGTALCAAEGPLLDPDSPRQSVIMQKVLGTASCGSPMPLTGPLDDADIECLEDWIATL